MIVVLEECSFAAGANMLAIKLTSQVLRHASKSSSESKRVYSGLGTGNKGGHCNLPTRFSIDENSPKGGVLKQPRDWKVNSISQQSKSSVTLNCLTVTLLKPKRRAERTNVYCQQNDGELDRYFESLVGLRVTSVTLRKRATVSFKDRKSFTLDDKYRVSFHDILWFGLDGELPEQSDEENHPKVETKIIPVELLKGQTKRASEVVTVIVPVDQTLRNFWMRVDLSLSTGVRFKEITVSYMDFNLLNENAWIDGRPMKVSALVSDLQRRIARGEWVRVVQIKAAQLHGYRFTQNRWFALMQIRLYAGAAEIVLGDMKNNLVTGTWPTAVPYTEGCQGQMNIYV